MSLSLRERLFGKTVSKEFSFKGVSISLRSLTEKENTEVWSKASPVAPATSVRTPMLARAIVRLDGSAPDQHPDIIDATKANLDGQTITRAFIIETLEKWIGELTVSEVDQLWGFYNEVEKIDKANLGEVEKKA